MNARCAVIVRINGFLLEEKRSGAMGEDILILSLVVKGNTHNPLLYLGLLCLLIPLFVPAPSATNFYPRQVLRSVNGPVKNACANFVQLAKTQHK